MEIYNSPASAIIAYEELSKKAVTSKYTIQGVEGNYTIKETGLLMRIIRCVFSCFFTPLQTTISEASLIGTGTAALDTNYRGTGIKDPKQLQLLHDGIARIKKDRGFSGRSLNLILERIRNTISPPTYQSSSPLSTTTTSLSVEDRPPSPAKEATPGYMRATCRNRLTPSQIQPGEQILSAGERGIAKEEIRQMIRTFIPESYRPGEFSYVLRYNRSQKDVFSLLNHPQITRNQYHELRELVVNQINAKLRRDYVFEEVHRCPDFKRHMFGESLTSGGALEIEKHDYRGKGIEETFTEALQNVGCLKDLDAMRAKISELDQALFLETQRADSRTYTDVAFRDLPEVLPGLTGVAIPCHREARGAPSVFLPPLVDAY